MVINGLVIGNTYRLQLISVAPNSGTVAVEGSAEYTWSGNNTMLAATWTAEDTTLNMQYSRKQQSSPGGQGGEVTFNGYALHDITQPSTLCNITGFTFPGLGAATIGSNTITLTVPWGTPVTALAPSYTLSAGASCNKANGGPATYDITNPVTYTVTAPDPAYTKNYTVTVQSYSAWSHAASMFILTTPDGANLAAGAPETNFPVLVRLNASNFNFNQAEPDGADLRFTTAAGAALSYQIEQWDKAAASASIWVLIQAITGNARQEIRMYWGQTGAPAHSHQPKA